MIPDQAYMHPDADLQAIMPSELPVDESPGYWHPWEAACKQTQAGPETSHGASPINWPQPWHTSTASIVFALM